ncbi:MAG: phenylalanine--tRNA ligase subunit beta [Candidatus Cyclobacteriaceae bacterium M3_2C_046]
MKISYNWLNQYIDLGDLPAEKIADLLTSSGLEVEGLETFEQVKGGLEGLVIGEVITCKAHPNADKLSLTTVDIGQGQNVSIVCGAPNVAAGQKVVVAPVGSTLYPTGHKPFKIKKAKIRGEVSEGMICAEDEIGLGTSHDGIMVLETDLPNGIPVNQYFNIETDKIFEIGLTPNRADATSHIGVARDLKALLKKELHLPSVDQFKVDQTAQHLEVIVENLDACPRYSGLTISNLTVKESPEWLQVRLQAIGQTPINNVVDVTNFILHELGQPLHAFDADKIKGGKVVVKMLQENTKFITLDEKERKLQGNDLMICDAEGGMCIAGVFGGAESGVKAETKSIFLESAHFSPEYIRSTAQHHDLKTDASFRFERGTDPEITVYALKRAALLIKEVAGGEISSNIVDVYPQKIDFFMVPAKFRNINRLIGKELSRQEILEILDWLDIQVANRDEDGFMAKVPSYRVDVRREADLIEEILRIYGYDKIEISDRFHSDYLSEFPEVDLEAVQHQVTQLLAGSGMNEIITNSLTKPLFSQNTEGFDPAGDVQILNKLSEDLGVMRQSLLFTGLGVIAYNISHRQRDLKFFEFGKVYQKGQQGYLEKQKLALYITGNIETENWRSEFRSSEFHDISAIIYKIFNKFIPDSIVNDYYNESVFEYGLESRHQETGLVLARFGKIKPAVALLEEIKQEIYYAEVDWENLVSLINRTFKYVEVSKYPEVRRDLSLVLDKGVSFEEIKNIALSRENSLIKSINIFDYYEGENIGHDKKAYALSFILQDQDRTLTDKVIDKTMDKLMQTFQNELGAIIRK